MKCVSRSCQRYQVAGSQQLRALAYGSDLSRPHGAPSCRCWVAWSGSALYPSCCSLLNVAVVLLLLPPAAPLQADLVKTQEEAAALREGSSDVASLQAQLAAAQEEATGLRNNSEEVEYLQAQLRRTLRQVVELQRQVRAELQQLLCMQ